MRVYKYVGPEYADKVIGSPDRVTLKCSTPDQFNDPYELFLTMDFRSQPKVLAFYSEIVGDLPQLPTTCFSHSPIVVPMWAHYAQELKGFVVEFDEEKLAARLPDRGFDDVDYQDDLNRDMEELFYRAYEIGKPRYIYLLRQSIFSAAYYTKASCWSYEQEKRLIVQPDDVRNDHGLMLLDIPKECVSALILGPNASDETAEVVRAGADQLECDHFELRIGKTTTTPFLVNSEGITHTFDGQQITPSRNQCVSCKEPISQKNEKCSWCGIDDVDRTDAAERNIFRAMDRLGILEDYISDMNDISRGRK